MCFFYNACRLYPVIPINARVLTKDCILDNHLIPKGTCVLLNTYTMSRNEEFFEKPDEFIPERWSREEKEFHPFSSLPFGFGSRSCVGKCLFSDLCTLYFVIHHI